MPRCALVINLGNPTGAVYGKPALETLMDVATQERLLLLADEVYQENIIPPSTFKSCKSLLRGLQNIHADHQRYSSIQLISLHSVSKEKADKVVGTLEPSGFLQ